MERSQPRQASILRPAGGVPPGVLITFIPSIKQIDVIGFHPTDPDVEITLMVSSKRRMMTESGFENHDRTMRYSIMSDTGNRTDLIVEISEQRYYGDHKQLNKIQTTLSHLSFDVGKPTVFPDNRYDIEWKEGRDGKILELSQHIVVKDAYKQESHFDAKDGKTTLTAEFEGRAMKLSIDGLMIAHRCVSSPSLWPEHKTDPRYIHSILSKHVRVNVLSLTPAQSKLQNELDIISRTAHIKSCETCISDYADLQFS